MSPAEQYPVLKDCFDKEKQLQSLKTNIDYWAQKKYVDYVKQLEAMLRLRSAQFELEGCQKIIEAKRQADTKAIADKYSKIAETRIVTDSTKTRNTLIVISGLTLIAAVALIIKYNK